MTATLYTSNLIKMAGEGLKLTAGQYHAGLKMLAKGKSNAEILKTIGQDITMFSLRDGVSPKILESRIRCYWETFIFKARQVFSCGFKSLADISKQLKQAEQAAEKLGVVASYKNNPFLAEKTTQMLQKLADAGVDVSNISIIIDKQFHQVLKPTEKGGFAFSMGSLQPDLRKAVEEKFLPDHLSPEKLKRITHNTQVLSVHPSACGGKWGWSTSSIKQWLLSSSQVSTRHPIHTVIHELMHALHYKNLAKQGVKLETINSFTASDEFWADVKKRVSPYAARDRKVLELIAEIGTAKLAGKKLDLTPEIQAVWDRYWKGAELPFGILEKGNFS